MRISHQDGSSRSCFGVHHAEACCTTELIENLVRVGAL